MCEGEYGRVVRNALVEALWLDCDTRAKSVGDMASSARYGTRQDLRYVQYGQVCLVNFEIWPLLSVF